MEITDQLCIWEEKIRFASENGRKGLCDNSPSENLGDCFYVVKNDEKFVLICKKTKFKD